MLYEFQTVVFKARYFIGRCNENHVCFAYKHLVASMCCSVLVNNRVAEQTVIEVILTVVFSYRFSFEEYRSMSVASHSG